MLKPDFMRHAGNAWRSAACELQHIGNLLAAHNEVMRYRDLSSLTESIRENGLGR